MTVLDKQFYASMAKPSAACSWPSERAGTKFPSSLRAPVDRPLLAPLVEKSVTVRPNQVFPPKHDSQVGLG
jgi:hypothetical protein